MGEDGIWNTSIKEDLKGKFYTFNVKLQKNSKTNSRNTK